MGERLDLRSKRIGGLPILSGAINGGVAFLLGLVATFLLSVLLGSRIGIPMYLTPTVDFTGFLFFGAHFVPTDVIEGSVNLTLVGANGGVLYVLVIAALLLDRGYYLGSRPDVETLRRGFKNGALLVAGYLPLVVLGASSFTWERSGSGVTGVGSATVSMAVPLLPAIALAGIAFPVLFGGLGGAFAVYRGAGDDGPADE